MGKKSRAKLEKKKRRERKVRKARNVRRGMAMVDEDGGEIDLDVMLDELPTSIQVERVLRRVARATGTHVFSDHQDALSKLGEAKAAAGGDQEAFEAALGIDDPREAAQDLAFLAMSPDLEDRALELVELALERDPSCVDALSLRALHSAGDPVPALAAVAADAERALGGRAFLDASRGRLWEDVWARPYLRARRRLASVLWNAGRRAEAAPHLAELLELAEDDPFEAGDFLLGHDLERGDLERARAGIERSETAGSPVAPWARALERWLSGERREAAAIVREAGVDAFAVLPELIEPGSFDLDDAELEEEEAIAIGLEDALFVDERIGAAWRAHEDAHRWLADGARETTALEREAACVSYRPPVSALLAIGEIDDEREWIDYAGEHGLADAHVPELVRMAADVALDELDGDDPRSWAPQHAWRALASLRAASAVAPLLEIAEARPWDDALQEDLPDVLARIGRPALEPLLASFADGERELHERTTACECLARLADRDPSCREATLESFARELGRGEDGDAVLNGCVVAAALDLGAAEIAQAIDIAYETGRVDEEIAGRRKDAARELRRARR